MRKFSSVRDAAKFYLDRGWTISPVHGVDEKGCRCRDLTCEKKNHGKHHPANDILVKSGGHVFTPADFSEKDNIAVWFGETADPTAWLVGVDLDRTKDGNQFIPLLPPTYTVQTVTGAHLYFMVKPDLFLGNWVDCFSTKPEGSMDIRYMGGRLIAPSSRGAFGPYVISDDREPAWFPRHAWDQLIQRRHARGLPVHGSWSAGR